MVELSGRRRQAGRHDPRIAAHVMGYEMNLQVPRNPVPKSVPQSDQAARGNAGRRRASEHCVRPPFQPSTFGSEECGECQRLSSTTHRYAHPIGAECGGVQAEIREFICVESPAAIGRPSTDGHFPDIGPRIRGSIRLTAELPLWTSRSRKQPLVRGKTKAEVPRHPNKHPAPSKHRRLDDQPRTIRT